MSNGGRINEEQLGGDDYDGDGNNKLMIKPFLTISDQAVYFEENWDQGIGGGLWSTGLIMARYFQTQHAADLIEHIIIINSDRGQGDDEINRSSSSSEKNKNKKNQLSVLELGSGNGLVAASLLALLSGRRQRQQQQQQQNNTNSSDVVDIDLVITDTHDHLDLIRNTMDANSHLLLNNNNNSNNNDFGNLHVVVTEHKWGEFEHDVNDNDYDDLVLADSCYSIKGQITSSNTKFDLVLGSDVAYRQELYDPLIQSLIKFSTPSTIIIIGVTMADTKPSFFHKLRKAGFTYRRFADHLMNPIESRGTTFGIFLIQRIR